MFQVMLRCKPWIKWDSNPWLRGFQGLFNILIDFLIRANIVTSGLTQKRTVAVSGTWVFLMNKFFKRIVTNLVLIFAFKSFSHKVTLFPLNARYE